MTSSPFRYVPGCHVAYRCPTDRRGSQWVATIRRGQDRASVVRAAVPFADGPDAAAAAACEAFNRRLDIVGPDTWRVLGAALSLDGGTTYGYPVGPAHLAPVLALPPVG